MHYYGFNISDYYAATRHLTALEDLAYRRMLDAYYLDEKPFAKAQETKLVSDQEPSGTSLVSESAICIARRIDMREHAHEVEAVLREFFRETSRGFVNDRADTELRKYRKAAANARANGRLGGRPKKAGGNPAGTHEEPSGAPSGSKRKPTGKLQTQTQTPTPEKEGSKEGHSAYREQHGEGVRSRTTGPAGAGEIAAGVVGDLAESTSAAGNGCSFDDRHDGGASGRPGDDRRSGGRVGRPNEGWNR